MAKQKCPECPKCLPGWLVQFGDLMSLLLTFFILLLSMAVMDKVKVEEYIEVMKRAMGFLDNSSDVKMDSDIDSTQNGADSSDDLNDPNESSMQESINEISKVVDNVNVNQVSQNDNITVEKDKNEFTLDIPSSIMFEDGSYSLNKSSKAFIVKIARIIRTMPDNYNIEIIGHTDTNRLDSSKIPRDSWDLSALRSISVVKELIKNRIDPSMLKVAAFASYHPKSDVSQDNRRVEIRFFGRDNNTDILNEENFFDRLQ